MKMMRNWKLGFKREWRTYINLAQGMMPFPQ